MLDTNSIIELYKNGKSITEISKLHETYHTRIKDILLDNNIEILSVSDSIKKFYKNNPDKHPWKKNSKFISKPCENFKKILVENKINYIEEYSPFEDRLYSMDIVLPEYKIGYEINGNQHYNKDGSLKDYYIERENYIIDKGWKLYQIHYSLSYDSNIVMEIVKQSINDNKIIFDFDYDEYLLNKLNKKLKIPKIIIKTNKCSCGELITNKSKICLKCYDIKQRTVERPCYSILKKEIEILGYVGTGKKYGVSDNSIRKWIKYYDKQLVLLEK